MKNLKSILLAGVITLGLGATDAYAAGNGNDGCQIGNIAGHKNHGQSNEHKINYMTKEEWLNYIAVNGLIASQISNNEGSNGWITWHIYDTNGKQIETVHIKYKKEEVPPVTEPEQPEAPEIPEIEKPEQPEIPEVEEDDKEEIPMTPIEPSIPVLPEMPDKEENEDNIPMVPIIPSTPIETPNAEEEDKEEIVPPVTDEEDNNDTSEEEQPSEDDTIIEDTEEDVTEKEEIIVENTTKEEKEEIKAPIVNNNTIKEDIVDYRNLNPKTGDAGTLASYLGLALSSSGLAILNRKRK